MALLWYESTHRDQPKRAIRVRAFSHSLRDLNRARKQRDTLGRQALAKQTISVKRCDGGDVRGRVHQPGHISRGHKEITRMDRYGQAVQERRYLAYELDWSRLFIDQDLPDVSAYSRLGKAFLARAAIRRALGEAGSSREDLSTAMRLARSYDRLPLLLCQVLQTGLLTSLLDEIRAGLDERFFDQTRLGEIADLLEEAPTLPGNYLAGLRFERALILELLTVVEASGDPGVLPNPSASRQGGAIRHALYRRLMNANRLALCEDQQELFLGPGARLADVDRWQTSLSLRLADRWGQFIAPLGHEGLVSAQLGTGLAWTLFTADATLHRTRMAVALSRYEAEHGAFPPRLGDLLRPRRATSEPARVGHWRRAGRRPRVVPIDVEV